MAENDPNQPIPTPLSFPDQGAPPDPLALGPGQAPPDLGEAQQAATPVLAGSPGSSEAQGNKPGLPLLMRFVMDQIKPPMQAPAPGQLARPVSRLNDFENFLGQFSYSFASAMGQAGHGPGAFGRGFGAGVNAPLQYNEQQLQQQQQQGQIQQQQAQTAQENARTQQIETQTKQASQMVTIPTPSGPVTMPYSLAVQSGFLKGGLAAETSAESKRYVNVAGTGLVDTQAQGGPSVVVANKKGGVEITSDMASQYSIPKQFIGSPIDLKTLATMEKAGPQTTTKLQRDPVTGLVTSTVTSKGPAQPGRGLPGSLGKGGAPSAPASGGSAQPSGAKWDPSSIPVKLVEGSMDPSQLSKRGSTYSFYLEQADRYSREKYGQPFDIAQASSDYSFAKNTQTQSTIKYLNSLTGADGKSGNLGALIDMSNKISRTDFPAINDAAAWARLETGDPAMASYHTAITEVADQVGKILQGGGSGAGTSDAKLKQAQEMFRVGFSKDQITGVGTTLRTLLGNRKSELIGDNRYLQRQYGGVRPSQRPSGDSAVDALVRKYAGR